MRMLNEVFELDNQFGNIIPRVELGEELYVRECRRKLYDFEAMKLYDVAGVGMFTSRGKIVGLVPEGLEQTARDAMGPGLRAIVIDNVLLPPRVRMTDEEAREKTRREEERQVKILCRRQTAFLAVLSLVFLIIFAVAGGAYLSLLGLAIYSIFCL